ncbi:outer envelope pore protein 16, chloroplastic [Rutidosis leptorrhynchoides]|uniref:outer envelope pore protein 16, chloroplastic n=1 Tax=Rutidosis leptorrhynchoides TaxID=125765 RepID=UPI003A9916AB
MPRKTIMGSLSSPKVDVFVDLGNPLLNHTLDGFLKIGTVAVAKVAVEETYHVVKRGSVSKHNFETSLKKMCKEGAYWGSVAGVYVGMEYGVERVRGTRDWKNAMIGGALTGALVSAVSSNKGDKIVMDAITGGAIATAAEFISYLT